jgi:hypothetical protein
VDFGYSIFSVGSRYVSEFIVLEVVAGLDSGYRTGVYVGSEPSPPLYSLP